MATMEQVAGPDPAATIRATVRYEGAVIGQFYVAADAEGWFSIAGRPFALPGDIAEEQTGSRTRVRYEWIGPYASISSPK